MRTLALLALFAIAALPAAAQSGAGTSALQYYVGTWSCMGGPPGQPPSKATITYTLDSGILRQTIDAPMQGRMKKAYMSSNCHDIRRKESSLYLRRRLKRPSVVFLDVDAGRQRGNIARSVGHRRKTGSWQNRPQQQ